MRFVIILYLVSSYSFSQNYIKYYETINMAEIAHLNEDYVKSDSLYQTAFRLVKKPFSEDFLLASVNSEKLNNNKLTYDYLKKGISRGLSLKKIKNSLCDFKKSSEWKLLKSDYKNDRSKFMQTINISLKEEIEDMIKNDQNARKPIFGGRKKMKKVDTYNYNRILEIIKENGNKWPGFSSIGENLPKGKYNVTGNITLLLLHFKKDWIKELQPYMLEAVLEGEMYPYHYARIIDYKNKCQIYGTYLDGGYTVEICDCKEAEIKRKKIGFEPIEDYYRKRNSRYKCMQ